MIAATDLKGRSFTKVADWNRDDLETAFRPMTEDSWG